MKTIQEIKDYLAEFRADEIVWPKIVGYLYANGIDCYKEHISSDNYGSQTFGEFLSWFNDRPLHGPIMDASSIIGVGDYVKVIDGDNSISDYVEFMAADTNGYLCYGLSDGTWVRSSNVIKYKYQGKERTALIEKLESTYE